MNRPYASTVTPDPPISAGMSFSFGNPSRTRWRLARAADMLRSGREPIVRVAERSGYDSEAAFTRAFKREFSLPPGAWRKRVDPT